MKKLPFSSGIVYHIALFPIAFLIVLATSKGICPLLYVSLFIHFIISIVRQIIRYVSYMQYDIIALRHQVV